LGELRILSELVGEAALLLWGLHMVRTGVERAFGARLRRGLGVALASPPRAFLAGLGVTAALQSSTATAFMLGAFVATGAVAGAPARAAKLGANVGTALIVQALAFDVTAVFPPLFVGGLIAFRKGRHSRTRDLGRTAIGLGLMLLALHLMVETMAPVESSPGFRAALGLLEGRPVLGFALAAIIAWAAHSSVGAVLFVASLAAAGIVSPVTAVAMTLGANLGSALNPLLQAEGDRGDAARLRLPLGNLLNRALACGIALAALPWATAALLRLDDDPARLVANAHLLLNLGAALAAFPLLGPTAALLRRLLPERAADGAEGAPLYLDESALGTPAVAVANAAREALRMSDGLEAMLRGSAAAFRDGADRDGPKAVARMDDRVDRLHAALCAYLARVPKDRAARHEATRLDEVRAFAVAVEHAADVVARDLVRHAAKRQRRGVALSAEALDRLEALHAALVEQLRLAVAVFLHGDAGAARALVRGKEALRAAEHGALSRLAERGGAAERLLLDAVRDLRRVGGHLAAVAHPLLERRGELLPSRLLGEGGA
jgi:phosphate:Na+ symporter